MPNPRNLVHRQSSFVGDICASLVKGKIAYASVGIVDDNIMYSAFSHKSWQDTYRSRSLHQYDPSLIGALQANSIPIFWDAVPVMTKKAASIMRQRREYTHVSSGVTISFRGKARVAVITLGSKLNSIDFIEYLNQDAFQYLNVKELLWKTMD